MLLAHLHSIARTHRDATIEVRHQDLPAAQLDALVRAHPRVRFLTTHFDFTRDRIQRISSKTLAWEQAALAQSDDEEACFLDVDTLVCRDLRPYFSDPECDVVFTYKDDGFVLNTGVLLCRLNAASRAFFQSWREATLAILRDAERFARANDPRLPFGAADQMALHEMLGYRAGETRYEVEIAGQRVRFRGEPCAVLNETRCAPITTHTHLLHFKGGWQPILLDGWRFTRNRPRAACAEMYLFYLATFSEALAHLNATLGTRWQPREFGIHLPRYLARQNPRWQRLGYALHSAAALAREGADFARRALRLASRKLHLCRTSH